MHINEHTISICNVSDTDTPKLLSVIGVLGQWRIKWDNEGAPPPPRIVGGLSQRIERQSLTGGLS